MSRHRLSTPWTWRLADQLEAILQGAEPERAATVAFATTPENFENLLIATRIRDEETVIARFGIPDLATIDEPRRVDDDRPLLGWLIGLTRMRSSAVGYRGALGTRGGQRRALGDFWIGQGSS